MKNATPPTRGTAMSSMPRTPFTKGTATSSGNSRTITSHSEGTEVKRATWQQNFAPKLDAHVFPSVVEFHGAEPGTLYVLTLTIQNVSSQAKRIRIVPPEGDDFTVNYTPAGPVAPGLEVRAEVEFLSQELGKDYHDQLTVMCDKQKIRIPLHAYAPRPDIVASDTLIDFGVVVLNNNASQRLSVINTGTKEGQFRITFDSASAPLTAHPDHGLLRAQTNPNDLYEESKDNRDEDDEELLREQTDSETFSQELDASESKEVTKQIPSKGERMRPESKGNSMAITNSMTTEIEFVAREVGPFHAVARVEVSGQPPRMINIHALVVEQRVELNFPESNKDIVRLTSDPDEGMCADFGTSYFGQSQTMKVAVVNNGPHSCTYQIRTQPMEGFEAYLASPRDGVADTSHSSASNARRGRGNNAHRANQKQTVPIEDADLQVYGDRLPIRIFPMEGLLGPYQEQMVEVTFAAKPLEVKRGFKVTQEKQGKLKFATLMQLVCLETNQLIDLNIAGAAVETEVGLSATSFKFGECPTNDRRDIVLTVTNKSDELPVDFKINKVAFFSVNPGSGKLLPNQKLDIIVSFTPGQMGKFRNTLHMVIGKKIVVIPLRVLGTCTSKGDAKTMPGGPNALPSNFKPQYKFVRAHSDPDRMIQDGVIVDESVRPKFTRKQAWQHLESQRLENPELNEQETFQVTDDAPYTYSLEDLKRRQAHRDQYDKFLKNAIQSRKEQMDARKALRLGIITRPGMEDSVDIGVEPRGGLQSPTLKPPKSQEGNGDDAIWLDRPLQGDERVVTRRRRRPKVFNENKLVKRKFKTAPLNQTEMRDCSVKLSADQLELVNAGPKVLSFGTVCVNSKSVKSYSVCNDLSHEIFVEIAFDDHEELINSFPKSQVIPPGATAGFDVCFFFQAHSADGGATRLEAMNRIFRKTVSYTINGQHRMSFNTTAEVVPIHVELSTNALQFRFPEDNMEKSVTETINLVNTGNAVAKFSFLTPAQVEAEAATHTEQLMTTSVHSLDCKSSFSVSPAFGFIDPYSNNTVAVSFTPSQEFPNVEKLLFRVEGGKHQHLECTGQVDEPRCVFLEKKIDFGQVAVGLRQERIITLKNIGNFPAVFWAEGHSSSQRTGKARKEVAGQAGNPDGIIVAPQRGRIPTGESVELLVRLEPQESREYQSANICCQLRGGRSLKLPLAAEALVPKLRVVQEEFDFGGVTVGCRANKTITLVNESNVSAVVFIDLSSHPDLSVSLLRDAGDVSKKDDDLESVMVPMTSSMARNGMLLKSPSLPPGGKVRGPPKRAYDFGLGGIQEEDEEGAQNKSPPRRPTLDASEDAEEEYADQLQDEGNCTQFRISVGPKKTLLLNLTFTPSEEKEYAFELPMQLAGVDQSASTVFRKLVTAQGLKPRIHISSSKVDFGEKVINTKNVKKLPYYHEVTLRNSDLGPIRWYVDDVALKNGPSGGVFGVDPVGGILEHDESVATLRISFLPEESSPSFDTLPIFVEEFDASKSSSFTDSTGLKRKRGKPYLEIALSGEGTYPKLTFDTSCVVLPPVPLGVKSRGVFYVNNEGYDNLELDVQLPPSVHRIPLSVSYPEGKILGMSKSKLPVQLNFVSRKPMSFTAKVHLVDTDGARFSIPVVGTAENCLLTNLVYINNYRDHLGFYRQAETNKPTQLLHSSQIRQLEGEVDSDTDTPPPPLKSPTAAKPKQLSREASTLSLSSNVSALNRANNDQGVTKEALPPSSALVAKSTSMDVRYPEPSTAFLIRWLNTTLLKSPIIDFPDDIIQAHGKPVIDLLESLMGKPMPGRSIRISSNRREQPFQLLKQYTELLNYVKANGGLLHNARPEHLLSKDGYVRVSMAATAKDEEAEKLGSPGTSANKVAPTGGKLSAQAIKKRHELENGFDELSRQAWTTLLYQCVKILLLNRVTPKHIRSLPGMETLFNPSGQTKGAKAGGNPRDSQRRQNSQKSGSKIREGKGARRRSLDGTNPKYRKKRDPASKFFENLSGSNVYGASEELLLRWMAYHAERGQSIISKYNSMNTVVTTTAATATTPGLGENSIPGIVGERGLTNFDSDLRDGTILCAVIVSHVPTTCGKGKHLSQVNFGVHESDQTTMEQNVTKAMLTLKELGLDFYVNAQEWVSGVYKSWDCLLLVLYLFQQLPQFIPKATIEFDCTLGCVASKALELKNPSKKLVNYHVYLEGSSDFSAKSKVVRLDPKSTDSLILEFCSRFSKPTFARLTLKPERTGGSTATTLVFLLKSMVTTRNATQSIRCTSTLYEPLQVNLEVTNPFDCDCEFKLSVFQEVVATHPLLKLDKKNGNGSKKKGRGPGRGRKPVTGNGDEQKRIQNGTNNDQLQREPPKSERQHELPFTCSEDTLSVSAKGTETLTIQFLPFQLGEFRCEIVFLDDQAGEFLYEIIGVTEIPGIMEKLEFRTEMKPLVSKSLLIPLRNPTLDRAISLMHSQMHSGPKGTRRSSLASRALRKQPDPSLGEVPTEPVLDTFLVEFSTAFFGGPADAQLLATRPEIGNDLVETKSNSRLRLLVQDIKKESVSPSANSTFKSGKAPSNQLQFTFQPKAPGVYSTVLAMYCPDTSEVRLYELEATVTAPPIQSEIEFITPARQSVVQSIPIVNNTDVDWTLQIAIQGDIESFSGPRTLHVSANGGQASYHLQFRPKWVGNYSGTLDMNNPTTNETMTYKLLGVAEEPLAEDHVVIDCQARDMVKHKFRVANETSSTVTYQVESDIPHVSGESTLVVGPGPGAEAEYELMINPLNGGTYTGSITFSQGEGAEKPYYWYTVELNVSSPSPEEVLDLQTQVRKAVSLEITLANPLRETVEFEVSQHGHGLLGDPVFLLGPEETASYELIYSPLLPGSQVGSISFVSSEVGEIWYELNLTSEPADTVELEPMECAIGSKTSRVVTLENPSGSEVELKTYISNRRNFAVSPSPVLLKPYSSAEAAIEYTPSSLDRLEEARIELTHPTVGKWVYSATGRGSQPSTMAPVTVVANIGTQMSSTFTFRNPFTEPLTVNVSMSSPADEINLDARGTNSGTGIGEGGNTNSSTSRIFTLLLKRQHNTIPEFGTMQIPFAFAPREMAEHTASVTVKANGNDLSWTFPLRGITEALPTDLVYNFQCKAREVMSKVVQIPLEGVSAIMEDETFAYEISVQEEELQEIVMRSFSIKPVDSILRPEPAEFQVDFEPLRPFEAHLNLIIKRRNGGRWRHHIFLEAKQAEPDDTIVIHSGINSTSTVTFKLCNTYADYAHFRAYFTPDSSYEFSVFPLEGELQPAESDDGGTLFSVSFTPTEYGKKFTGRLVIDTEDMQWNYVVRGFHPTYQAPQTSAKVSSHPRKSVLAALTRAHHHTNSHTF